MQIERKKLLDALKIANRVVEKKSSMPILASVQLDGKSATLRGTDLDTGVVIPLEIARTDEIFTLPAKQLTDIVRSLDVDDVKMTAMEGEGNEGWVNINGMFEISGYPNDEFPVFEIPETTGYATVGKSALQNVISAVTKEEAGFSLSGVYFDAEQEKCVATDGHRLHMEPISIDCEKSFMVGAAALKTIMASTGKDEDEITVKTVYRKVVEREGTGEPPDEDILEGLKKAQLIELADDYFNMPFDNKNKVDDIREFMMDEMQKKSETVHSEEVRSVVAKTENATFVVRVAETRFPDYQAIVPKESKHRISVKRGDFLAAVKQALTMTNERYKAVKLTFNGKGTIEMNAVNPDIGSYQRLTVPMTGHVDPAVEAGFNPSFLQSIMEITKDNEAEFEVGINSDSLPLTFNHGSFEGLVMPMRV